MNTVDHLPALREEKWADWISNFFLYQ